MNKIFWGAFFICQTISLYLFVKMSFAYGYLRHSGILDTNTSENPWIPVILAVIGLASAIIAFLRERKPPK